MSFHVTPGSTLDLENNKQENKKTFDYKAFAFKCLNYWYLFIIGILIAVGYSYYTVRYYVPQYSVDARILLKDEYSSWGQEYFLPGMELVSERNRLVNEIGAFRSFGLMREVIDNIPSFKVFYYDHGNIKTTELYPNAPFEINTEVSEIEDLQGTLLYLKYKSNDEFILARTEEFENPITKKFGEEFIWNGKKLRIDNKAGYSEMFEVKLYSFSINDLDYLAKYYQNSIAINLEENASSIILLGMSGPKIQKEIDFLNVLIETYIREKIERSNQIASKTIDFVDEQITKILDTLIIAEEQLQKFKSNINVQRIPLEEEDLITEILDLEKQKYELQLRLEFYDEVLSKFREDDMAPIILPTFITNVGMANQIKQLNEQYQKYADVDFMMTDKSINVERYERNIKESRSKVKGMLEFEERLEKSRLKQVKQAIARLENKVRNIPAAERNYVNIKRTYQLNSDLYTFLLQKKSDASIAKASNISKVEVLDYASTLRVRYSGLNSGKLYLTSFGFAITLPMLVVFLIHILNNKIIDRKDLAETTKIPIIGVIGHNTLDSNLVIFSSPRSIIAEAFRTIRTQINFLSSKKDSTVILLSSSISGEGKTFCSINLASAYSSLNCKTILLGADLRRPKIYDDFEYDNSLGLSDYLIGEKTLDECVTKTDFPHLDLLISGPIPPNPSELLNKPEMKELMDELRKRYDIIIIDTPPVGLVADALLLQKYVDVNLYVVRQHYTRKNHLEIINDYYSKDLINNIGIIVNDIKQRKIGYGGYYGYGYGYGYGYSKEYTEKS